MQTTQVAFRLPNDLLERVDAYVEQFRRDTGVSASRTEMVRVLLEKGLGALAAKKKS